MPTRLHSMGYIPLDFIDENPTMKSFRAGQAFDLAQRRGEVELEQQMRQNEFARQADPIKLRNFEATTSKNETEAKYADEDEREKLRDRSARTELSVLRAINERYDAGDFEGGDQISRRTNTPISPEWRSSAETRQVIKNFDAEAQRRYPNRPADQLDYIQKGMTNFAQKRQSGAQLDQSMIFDVPDAPPPITEITPKAQHDPMSVATVKFLMQTGIAKNYQDAWSMANEAKYNPENARDDIYGKALSASFGDTKAARKAVEDWQSLTQKPSQSPAPNSAIQTPQQPQTSPEGQNLAASTRQAPGGRMTGAGTRMSPYKATTQSDIDWFKNNAKPGSVIEVDGRQYTK